MIKLKVIIGLAATVCAMVLAVSHAGAEWQGQSKGRVAGGTLRLGLVPGGANVKCKTVSGKYDIKKGTPQEQTTKGPHQGFEYNYEGKPHSKTTTGKCEIEPVAGTFLQAQVNNPLKQQLLQPTLGQTTGLADNLEKTLEITVDGAACTIVGPPASNQNRTKTTVENNGANLKIKPEIEGITTEAIGAGCAVGGIKGGKEGSLRLETGEILESEGIKEI